MSRVDPSVIAELGDWAVGAGPLFRQLARAMAGAIERGALPRGARLPSERALAAALAVSRGTAVAAYDLLVADGFIERLHGSGTYVLGAGQLGLPAGREGSALVHRLVSRSGASPAEADLIDLSISVLADSSGLPSLSLSDADLAGVVPETGYSPWGLPGLRQATADYVTGWGLPTRPDEVVITTGAQQGLACAAACWVRPSDVVVVDEPTYPGAVSAFTQAGAEVVGVPVDRHGVRAEELESAVRSVRPALVYVQSTLHSPTGAVLSEARRRRIAALVEELRVPLVEDMALAGLVWPDVRVPPPIASFAPLAPIAVVGSFSKVFWGGLRMGFVRAPEPVALRFARVKATHDLGSSAVSQVLAERLLADVAAIADCQSERLLSQCGLLERSLKRSLPSWTWPAPAGGLSLWVQLPTPTAESFAQTALRFGVAVATAQPLSAGRAFPDRLRLSFSLRPELLEEGVRRLAAAWTAGPSRSPTPPGGTRPR